MSFGDNTLVDPGQSDIDFTDPNVVYGPSSRWGQDTLSSMGVTNDTNQSKSNSGFDLSKVADWGRKVFTGQGSVADYGTLLGGVLGLYETMSKDRSPKMWEGKVQKAAIPQQTISPDYMAAVKARPYGAAAQGMDPFSYTAPARPDITLPGNISGMGSQDRAELYRSYRDMGYTDPEVRAAVERALGGRQSNTDWAALLGLAGYGPKSAPAPTALAPAAPAPTAPAPAAPAPGGALTGPPKTLVTDPAQMLNEYTSLRGFSETVGAGGSLSPESAYRQLEFKFGPLSATQKKSLEDAYQRNLAKPTGIAQFVQDYSPEAKAAAYENYLGRGLTDKEIRTMAEKQFGPQKDSDWAELQRIAKTLPDDLLPVTGKVPTNIQTEAAVLRNKLPADWDEYSPKQKSDWFNDNNATVAMLKSQGVTDAEIEALRQYGYKYAEGGITDLARGGALPPRYLEGDTDGMADKIPSSIDGVQPAKLSHGEFVIPADVVSHLGNGNSKRGAKVLYKMMDRVRMARTGTKKQGKQINPDKFTPGGIAGYAGGGAVAFETGGYAVNPTGSGGSLTGGLSPWVGDYVAGPQGFLSKAWSLGDRPYQAYTGPLTAGLSPLQNLGITQFQGLQTPTAFADAAKTAGGIATQLAGMEPYSPTSFTNQFTKPPVGYSPTTFTPGFSFTPGDATSFTNQFSAPTAYQGQTATSGYNAPKPYEAGKFSSSFGYSPDQATQFTNLYQAPSAYQGVGFGNLFNAPGAYQAADMTQGMAPTSYAAGTFTPGFNYQAREMQTGLGPVKSVQDYMSQYTGGVSDIAAREATRQADVSRTAEQARLAQAGAFGGSRQAIMEAERQRNLGTQISDIRTKGLQDAFDRAQQQRLAESGLGLQAQQASEQARQFGAERGAQFGLQAQQLGEQSRQFGADFGLKGLNQLLQARQATEASRQFGATQGMTAAQLAAQYGLAGKQAEEASRQFGATQEAQSRDLQAKYGLSTQQAQEAARQFNAGQKLTAEQLQAQFGLDAQKAQEMSRQFGAQQEAQTAETGARLGLQAQQQSAADRQFAAQQEMQSKQLQAQYGLSAQQAQEAARQFNAGQRLTAAQLQSQFGLDAKKAEDLSKQFASQQDMQAAQLSAQYGLAGLQAGEQAKQFGANLGLNRLQQALQAAQAQAALGQTGFQTDLQRLQAIMGAGGTQQAAEQAAIDAQIRQFQEAQMYPYKQLQFQQSMLQGLPVSTSTTAPNTSMFSDLTSGIGGLLGLYSQLNKAGLGG